MGVLKDFFAGFREGFKSIGEFINKTVVFIGLAIVYFTAVGVTWFFIRISGKRLLQTKRHEGTYWVDIKDRGNSIEEYRKPF